VFLKTGHPEWKYHRVFGQRAVASIGRCPWPLLAAGLACYTGCSKQLDAERDWHFVGVCVLLMAIIVSITLKSWWHAFSKEREIIENKTRRK